MADERNLQEINNLLKHFFEINDCVLLYVERDDFLLSKKITFQFSPTFLKDFILKIKKFEKENDLDLNIRVQINFSTFETIGYFVNFNPVLFEEFPEINEKIKQFEKTWGLKVDKVQYEEHAFILKSSFLLSESFIEENVDMFEEYQEKQSKLKKELDSNKAIQLQYQKSLSVSRELEAELSEMQQKLNNYTFDIEASFSQEGYETILEKLANANKIDKITGKILE